MFTILKKHLPTKVLFLCFLPIKFTIFEVKECTMKKLVFPFMIVAIIIGLYEQTKDKPNVYILVIAVAVFMYGIMQLSAKVPSKHSETEEEEDAN